MVLAITVATIPVGLVVSLASTFEFDFSRVGLTVDLDPSSVEPFTFVLWNPFRDRGPERIAEALLADLVRRGPEALVSAVPADDVERAMQYEHESPVRSWGLHRRWDRGGKSHLVYVVERGSPGHRPAEAHFWLHQWPEWTLEQYSAYDSPR